MTLKRARKLMLIETMCIKKANTCDRNCAECELVQKDDELLEAYKMVVGLLEDAIREQDRKEKFMVIENYDPEKHFNNGIDDLIFMQKVNEKIQRGLIVTYGELYEELGIPIKQWNEIYYEYLPGAKVKEVKMDNELSSEMLELKDLLQKCKGVSEYWNEQMPMMAAEEAGEFIQAIGKMERDRYINVESKKRLHEKNLKEEIADMYISLMAIQFHYGIHLVDIYEQMRKKLDVKYDEKGE